MTYTLHRGDCLEVLATLPDCSVDAIVTDPPAGIAFMGKAWDRDKGGKTEWVQWMQSVAAQCLRVIKPGGHALVWAIPRTSHWTGDAWEEAGWQVREKIYHVFGSGFPKSLDVSKQLDRMAGAEREVVGPKVYAGGHIQNHSGDGGQPYSGGYSQCKTGGTTMDTAPATPEAKQWAGWGTALKPAAEEWWLFRRPLEGTVAANVLKHGTGAINVDGCRVPTGDESPKGSGNRLGIGNAYQMKDYVSTNGGNETSSLGRWPANFTHDGSDEVTELLGDAARFFYSPKASKADRDEGCEGMEARQTHERKPDGKSTFERSNRVPTSNHHPTVKPVDLMTYLCRLITPPGGTILDPFTGSGSTGKAAILEDFKFIGIEREAEYIEIARARIDAVNQVSISSFCFKEIL